MSEITHAALGTFDPSSPGEREGTVVYANRSVTIDLTIEEDGLSEETLAPILARVDDLAKLDAAARHAIAEDAKGDEDAATVVYVDHHRDELPDEALRVVFGSTDRESLDAEAFLSRLFLTRVGVYPVQEDAQLLLDYTFSTDHTNYVLCVSFDDAGKVVSVDLES